MLRCELRRDDLVAAAATAAVTAAALAASATDGAGVGIGVVGTSVGIGNGSGVPLVITPLGEVVVAQLHTLIQSRLLGFAPVGLAPCPACPPTCPPAFRRAHVLSRHALLLVAIIVVDGQRAVLVDAPNHALVPASEVPLRDIEPEAGGHPLAHFQRRRGRRRGVLTAH